jgi:uridine kinase
VTPAPGPALPWQWSVVEIGELGLRVRQAVGAARPAVVAVNGHSSSGKSTFAPRLAAALPDAAVLHTDDLAWNHGVFAWDSLLRDDVLPEVRAGRAVSYRPPGWVKYRREGSVELPGSVQFLVLEGVGASQPSLADLLDVVVWVETDEPTRLARDLLRLAAGETTPEDYTSWMAEENAYVTAARPWEQATFVVNGAHLLDHADDEVVVAA